MKSFYGVNRRSVVSKANQGFTLIELLVVIAIIGIISGILIGVLGSGGNSSTSLQAAQTTVSSLLSAARGQAALTGQRAALAVNDNPADPDRYLHYCVVIVQDATGSWVTVNDGYTLPTGIYIVPPTAPTGSAVEAGVDFGAIQSDGFDATLLTNQKFNSTSNANWLVMGVNAIGMRVDATTGGTAGTGVNIVLSTATPQPPGSNPPMKFSNAKNLRGFSISQYGVAGFINDPSGF